MDEERLHHRCHCRLCRPLFRLNQIARRPHGDYRPHCNLSRGRQRYLFLPGRTMILKTIGGLGAVVFCMEWVVLALAFRVRYYAYLNGEGASVQLQHQQDSKVWHCPFQVCSCSISRIRRSGIAPSKFEA